MKAKPCTLCGGECADADLQALLAAELQWLWNYVADAADRRGDPDMVDGPSLTLTLPADATERSAIAGLVTATKAGQRTRIHLTDLTSMVQKRGTALTPGAVAAHATGRKLAVRSAEARARQARTAAILEALITACDDHHDLANKGEALHEHLRRTGWITRLGALGDDATTTVTQAMAVVQRLLDLPTEERIDRRLLVQGDPHALDEGTPLAGTTLALLVACGRVASAPGQSQRALWAQVGVDCDDLMGGLTTLGIAPDGWTLPADAVCTIPPRELARVPWPQPANAGSWVFVTENPSILAAAADAITFESPANPARVICTMGTPSAGEVAAIARIAQSGWRVAVRADFDPAGIAHVAALLTGVPGAVPWRMNAAHYEKVVQSVPVTQPIPATPWDPALHERMSAMGRAGFEESLLPDLLIDLSSGRPGDHVL